MTDEELRAELTRMVSGHEVQLDKWTTATVVATDAIDSLVVFIKQYAEEVVREETAAEQGNGPPGRFDGLVTRPQIPIDNYTWEIQHIEAISDD